MAIQVLENPYRPAQETGFEQSVKGFKPYLDLLTLAMLQGQAVGTQPTGRKKLTTPGGKTYTGESFYGTVPKGFQLSDETLANRIPFQQRLNASIGNQLDPQRTARALEQYKLQAAPYEMQKLQAETANQQALGGYYQAAARSMGGNQGQPDASGQGLAALYQRSRGNPQAEELLSQLLAQLGIQ